MKFMRDMLLGNQSQGHGTRGRLLGVTLLSVGCLAWPTSAADHPWRGAKVGFLGDSITDPAQTNRHAVYWQYLERDCGIRPFVHAISGLKWDRCKEMGQRLQKETNGDVDAILVLLGTNDYMGNIPLGEWYEVREEETNYRQDRIVAPRRSFCMSNHTLKGRINTALKYLKETYPDQQIVLLTPPHRGFARFGETNIQPPESFPNRNGVYFETYIQVLREAADIWSVPLIDLYRESGLIPCDPAYAKYFRDGGANGLDNLHPNALGHERMARVIAERLRTMPAGFRKECK